VLDKNRKPRYRIPLMYSTSTIDNLTYNLLPTNILHYHRWGNYVFYTYQTDCYKKIVDANKYITGRSWVHRHCDRENRRDTMKESNNPSPAIHHHPPPPPYHDSHLTSSVTAKLTIKFLSKK